MSLRIACDLDGTIADMDAALQREAKRLFGPDVDLHATSAAPIESAEDVEEELAAEPLPAESASSAAAAATPAGRPLSRGELRTLWSQVRRIEDFWCSLGEIEPGVIARFWALSTRHRWDIVFVTQRPSSAGATTQRQSQRWLHAHGFEMPSVFVNGRRGRVANALSLDAVIDDRPENCLDVVTDSKALPILVWRRSADDLPLAIRQTRIQLVPAFHAALDRLEQLTAEHQRGGTFLGRVRKAIGL
jgi:hypothetical protein